MYDTLLGIFLVVVSGVGLILILRNRYLENKKGE
jgi:hypothetical protein